MNTHTMLRRWLVLVPVVFCFAVAIASAATPKPGGTYKGSSSSHNAVSIVVARHSFKPGTYKGILRYCGHTVGIFIVRGAFGVHLTTAGGAVSVLRMNGFFETRQLVTGQISLNFASGSCSRPGTWSATLR